MITTLGELKAAVISRSHRADLAALVPEFVQLAEQDINRRMESAWDLATSGDGVSNWLLDNAASVYLFGALVQLAIHTHDDTGLTRWSALYLDAVNTAHQAWNLAEGHLDTQLETELYPESDNILAG